MISLKENIEEKLWDFVKKNYNSENYSNAILDSIQFVGDLIREKSGLDGDGNTLIGIAFGGDNPKIKLNNLQTETEKNIQKGIEQIFRGIYSAYRNPRSHSKLDDNESDANEIIIFVNHLLKILDKSKGKFSTEIFLQRVFDKDFVESKKYSDILVESIPKNKYYEVAIELYKQKSFGKIQNIRFVWKSIFQKLNESEKRELFKLVSEELRFEDLPEIVIKNFALFDNTWEKIDEDARLRAENKIINLITLAEKNIYGQVTKEGIFATWLTSIITKSELKDSIALKVEESLLSRNENKQRFILEYFGRYLKTLDEFLIISSFDEIFIDEIKNGNKLIYDFINKRYSNEDRDKFKECLSSFKEIKLKNSEEDDLPF
ncbi:TIGR02391 family protein [Flavobacterium sp. RSP49]|uniref:TIGR02391 family protein n=1 Tax=Flavobacterium sp. RSP49 TaxID=2497487 RepID=UPI000F933A17|nr:TIGR02391 family protein [Flavobacterium sp. RSP49]RTY98724.1 TIGR02391 family protein [Flavobacterium sp. RSP49]